MSETAFIVRSHLTKWQVAYLRWAILVLMAVIPDISGELKGYKEFGDITPINWWVLFCNVLYDAVVQTAAFLDKSSQNPKETKPAVQQQPL